MRKLEMEELGRLTPEEFRAREKTPIILLLDNVRSGMNVGSAFRTADAFAVEKIFLCGITAKPPHREILKTALGSTESMDWEHAESTEETIRRLQKEGVKVLAVEQAEGSENLGDFEVRPGTRYALVFGNELKGVGEGAMALVDGCLEIPQFGTKHSLNIAVSIGITVWDLFQKIKSQS
ncbi:MAG TPA: TrmH family RNA methyltransferase [Bacteroidetes bacterium]|nr:TrmH family RNA methyltransferase [Bacteroidota bacterium]